MVENLMKFTFSWRKMSASRMLYKPTRISSLDWRSIAIFKGTTFSVTRDKWLESSNIVTNFKIWGKRILLKTYKKGNDFVNNLKYH